MTREQDAFLLSGAYAVGATTPEESALVESAMRESEELRSEVVGLVDTAVALGLSTPPADPPSALRGRLLAAIAVLPQQSAEPAAEEERPVLPKPAVRHVAPRRRRRFRSPAVLVAAVVAGAVLFSGGFLVQRAVLQPQAEYAAIGAAADHEDRSAPVSGGGRVTVSWSASQHRTAVVVNGVTVPSDRVLQLWSIRGGTVTSEGLYRPQGDDRFSLLDGVPAAGERLAVSVEPQGGSATPTTIIGRVALDA